MKAKIEKLLVAGIGSRYWYEDSRNNAAKWVASMPNNGITLDAAMAVCSILSPRVQLQRSVALSKQWLLYRDSGEGVAGIMKQRIKALRRYAITGSVSTGTNTKIQDFHASLCLDKSRQPVCCDIWMGRIFGHNEKIMLNTKRWKATRLECQDIVRSIGRKYGFESWQSQACIWSGHLSKVYKNSSNYGAMKW